ncbi:MAG: isochorismatase family cysteine hydrolase [Candidatus Altiarchaeota archaeon]
MSEALLVIDMQKDVLEWMVPAGNDVLSNVKLVLEAFRDSGKPVVHILRVHAADGSDVEVFRRRMFSEKPYLVRGTSGAEVVGELAPLETEHVVEKQRFSAFFQTGLKHLLDSIGVDTLIVVGVQTPNCVRCTVTDAVSHDYKVILVRDAVAAATPEIHEANLLDLGNMGVELRTVEDIVNSV